MKRAQGTYSLPLNSGAPIRSSAIMQPIDQTSTIQASVRSLCKKCLPYSLAVLYFLQASVRNSNDGSTFKKSHLYASIISGARYHRVATYSVKCEAFSSGMASKPLLRPKSQILSSQSAFTRRFPGLRSRCITPAEWINFIP